MLDPVSGHIGVPAAHPPPAAVRRPAALAPKAAVADTYGPSSDQVESTFVLTPTRGLGSALRAIGSAIAHAVSNTISGLRLLNYAAIYELEVHLTEWREGKKCLLDTLPVPRIDRPFVIVPGWTTQPGAFEHLVSFLTTGGVNGGQPYYVKQGGFYTMGADGQLQPLATPPSTGRVFEIVWSDARQSPDRNVVEMRQNLDAICKVTGFDKVDAEGYSMGGLDTRLYVDQGGTHVNRFMMLGTPNHGSRFGDLVMDALDRDVRWAQKLTGVSMADHESMEWLRSENNSPKLADLNSRWDRQRAAVPTFAIGTDVMPTPVYGAIGLGWGDGMVTAASMEMPNIDNVVLHNAMSHGRLNDDEVVQHIRSIFFDWVLPPNANDYFPDDGEIIARVPHP